MRLKFINVERCVIGIKTWAGAILPSLESMRSFGLPHQHFHLTFVLPPADQAGSPVQARLRHFLQPRTQWLNISGEHVASVARVGQAVLHLELSR